MSLFVVDASVAIKWMLPEPHTPEALRLQVAGHQLHAPSFLDIELASVLLKKVRNGLLTRPQADSFLGQLATLSLSRHDDSVLITPAFDLANQTGASLYDCLYLALAVQLGGQMVTADDAFVNKLGGTTWATAVLRVQDIP